MDKISDWQAISRVASNRNMPVVVMVDQDHCPYCRRVESEFFPDFDGPPHADRPQPNKHAGVVEKLVCSAYLNICVDFGNSTV